MTRSVADEIGRTLIQRDTQMADPTNSVGSVATDATSAPSQPSRAYGPVEAADDTRQAQNQFANDEPTDVNFNAIVGRSQALTVDVIGKSFGDNADLRQKMADANNDWREIHKGRLFGAKKDA